MIFNLAERLQIFRVDCFGIREIEFFEPVFQFGYFQLETIDSVFHDRKIFLDKKKYVSKMQ